MEQYYDDSLVVLKDGDITVDGIKVAGSVTFRRDPRLSHLAQALMDMPPMWRAPRQMAQVAPGHKWCYQCSNIRPVHYFSPHKETFDKLDPRCKECENARRRMRYANSVDHQVRDYKRREKVAV